MATQVKGVDPRMSTIYAVRNQERRKTQTCIEKGHPVYRVGPYLICRSLRCDVLVVKEARRA